MTLEEILRHIEENYGKDHALSMEQVDDLCRVVNKALDTGKVQSTFYCLALGEKMIYPNKEYQKTLLARYGDDMVRMYTSFVSKRGRLQASPNTDVHMAKLPKQGKPAKDSKPGEPKASKAEKELKPPRSLTSINMTSLVDPVKDRYEYHVIRWFDGEKIFDGKLIW